MQSIEQGPTRPASPETTGDKDDLFEQLYREHVQSVCNVLYKYTRGDIDLAAQLAQEAFFKAYKFWDTYTGPETGRKYWLNRIVTNLGVDHYRKTKLASYPVSLEQYASSMNRQSTAQGTILGAELAVAEDFADELIDQVYWQQEIEPLIDEIDPPFQREIVRLRLAGAELEEIATMLDKTYTSVKQGYYRGYHQLLGFIERDRDLLAS